MKKYLAALVITATLIQTAPSAFAAAKPKIDSDQIEKITALKGAWNEAKTVFKLSSPRNDVKVSVDKAPMPPFMGLTSWVAYTSGKKKQIMAMGDLVLFQDEVNPVMSALIGSGINVTALHNHFFFDDPKVYFMHIEAEGTEVVISQGVRKAFDQIKEIRAKSPTPSQTFGAAPLPETSTIDGKKIEGIVKVSGETKDGMFKFVVGRRAKMSCGCDVEKDMGVNTWAAFMGSDENAIVDGDFVVLENEMQTVLKTLRQGGIQIVAIHNHMLNETPRYLFLHYWGHGKTEELARTLKSALDSIQSHRK